MSSLPPKSNTNVLVAPEPPSLSQPSEGSSEGPSQRNPQSRGNKKVPSKTVTLADAVQKTVSSHKVLQVDTNCEQGPIWKVSETRLKLRLEDWARVFPVGIIKGLLVWPKNCMLLHVQLHVCRLCTVLGTNFLQLLPQWAGYGSLVVSMSFVAGRLASEHEKKNLDLLRWQLQFECMVLKWDTPLRQRRSLASHHQAAHLSCIGAYMSERAVLLMENLEEPENADLSLTSVCRQMLEEAGLSADEGSAVCDGCCDAH